MFRIELDALNAIYKQLVKQNELLEKLLDQKEPALPIIDKPKRQYTRRANKDAI